MSLPAYEDYRDSGVEALGKIPSHWNVTPLKRVASVQTGIAKGKDVAGKQTISVPYLRVANVQDGYLALDDVATIEIETEQLARYRLRAGDVLMNEGGDFDKLGRGAIWSGAIADCIHQNHVFAVRPHGFDSRWLSQVTGSRYAQFYFMGRSKQSTNLASISSSNIMELPVVVPPAAERDGILAFLDRETSKIDALIAEQDKLIALLTEKRQATISHAVTRGLNPGAPMKDSGISWLGEIPAHWTFGKIQSFARRESGHTPSRQHPEYWENCTIPWFSLADVWQIRDGAVKYVRETKELVSELGVANSSARVLPTGTVILSRTASVGYSAIMGCDMATTQDFVNWVCKPGLNPEFLLYVLRGMRPEFDRLMMGSTHQTIYMPDIAKLVMAVPPLTEQAEIVAFVEDETRRLEVLAADAQRAITLLTERRSALIAAAVTGQIDVRQTVPTTTTRNQ